MLVEILRCVTCRGLTVGVCGMATCSRGCSGKKYDRVKIVPVPDEAFRKAVADLDILLRPSKYDTPPPTEIRPDEHVTRGE